MTGREIIEQSVEKHRQRLVHISDCIWDYAETAFQECRSSRLLAQALDQEGFSVEWGIGGLPTAFRAVWGGGGPVIGILGEYDALPNLSQIGGLSEKRPVQEGGNGHGCGHNLLGAGALAGAVALKDYLKKTGQEGTVFYYATPAEEGGCGKTILAGAGAFAGIDCALSWHPGTTNEVRTGRRVANYSRIYNFYGSSSHAGMTPHLGRSALDACEIMSVGANYLREHMIPEARLHYAYLNAGGAAPNVVQEHTSVRYFIRAPQLWQASELVQRVDRIAEGAALITDTKVEAVLDSACSDYLPNAVLSETMVSAMEELGLPARSEEEYALARQFVDSLAPAERKTLEEKVVQEHGYNRLDELLRKPIDTSIKAFDRTENAKMIRYGSTDLGDVGYIAPTTSCMIATAAMGTPSHTWQMTAQGKTALSHEGLLYAGKVLALTGAKLIEQPRLLTEAKDEFMARNQGSYICPLSKENLPFGREGDFSL